MGTRGIYTFKDNDDTRHVFVHYDSYPEGAAAYFRAALDSGKAWPLPRYEADEFAAGFIAAIKDGPGNVRICKTRREYCDVEFGYTVYQKNDVLMLDVATTDFWDREDGSGKSEARIWRGTMQAFIDAGGKI